MKLGMECKKIKRTGYIPAFICGGLLGLCVPVSNMAVRSSIYTGIAGSPVKILSDANWQMMAMLNVLLIILGACIIYHTEYADNGYQRMCTLPIKESRMFFSKFALTAVMCTVTIMIEAAGIAFSVYYWFEPEKNTGAELFQSFGYSLLLMLPAILTALLTASICKNMWISLGIGVVCVFTATMLPADNFILSLFPYALPFQTFTGASEAVLQNYITAGIIEIIVLSAAEFLILKLRRSFE